MVPVDIEGKEKQQFEMANSKTGENLEQSSPLCQCLYS